MTEPSALHADQIAYWRGAGGDHWVAQQALTDQVLGEVATILLDRAAPQRGENIIDIGCGCGATSVLLGRAVGETGRVEALDIAPAMLARARERLGHAPQVRFILGDAAVHRFEPQASDLLFSRFGVMFFGDPVTAFANLRLALKPGGRLVFACWRKPAENPWMMVPLNAAYQHVPRLPRPVPEEPGPFAFADPDRVTSILLRAGFAAPRFEPVDLHLDIGAGGGLRRAIDYTLEIGATSRALDGQPGPVRVAAAQSIGEALAPYVEGDAVRLGGAIWIVRADLG